MRYEGFLRAIAESPNDPGLRLIFADKLQDDGESDWEEFVRLGVSMQRRWFPSGVTSEASARFRMICDRSFSPEWVGVDVKATFGTPFWKKYRDKISFSFAAGISAILTVRGGSVERVLVSATEAISRVPKLRQLCPLRHVIIRGGLRPQIRVWNEQYQGWLIAMSRSGARGRYRLSLVGVGDVGEYGSYGEAFDALREGGDAALKMAEHFRVENVILGTEVDPDLLP